MRPRPLPLVCLALLLLALAWGLSGRRGPVPVGDEATPVMMVQSLWHDHDLTWRQADLDRAQALWGDGPAGLTLFTNDGGKTPRYGRPLAYPLAALPFYAVLGVRGIALLNMALFLAMAIAALWLLSEDDRSPLFVAGFFFASAALAYAFRLEPDVFLMACVFFPLLAWRRLEGGGRRDLALLAGAGILLGVAMTASPLLGLLSLPILIDLAARRRWRNLAAVIAGTILAVGLLALIQRVGTGEWSSFGGTQRRTFDTEFPLESPRDLWQGYRAEEASPGIAAGLRLLPRNLLYLLAGRFMGLLPYFPFALFALILYLLGRKDRQRHLLAAALLLYAALVLLLHPHDFGGAPGFLGSRYLGLAYPAFLFLPHRLEARRSLVFPYLAAGLWTATALLQTSPAASSTFHRLPLELTLIPGDHLPGYTAQTWGDAVWIVQREAFFVEERHPHGVWVRGGTRSDVIVVSPKPLSRLTFTAYSLSAANVLTLDGGAGRLTVRFDTEGKRGGTPIDLPLASAARGLGFFPAGPEHFYRLTLETTAGLVPARVDPKSQDPRDLGVFLDFTGGGP